MNNCCFAFLVVSVALAAMVFCHLGDRHFCAVVTGSLPEPLLPIHFQVLDQNRRYISIRVFQEISTQSEPQPIPAELLYSTDYLFQSTYSSFGTLLGCYPSDMNLHSSREFSLWRLSRSARTRCIPNAPHRRSGGTGNHPSRETEHSSGSGVGENDAEHQILPSSPPTQRK